MLSLSMTCAGQFRACVWQCLGAVGWLLPSHGGVAVLPECKAWYSLPPSCDSDSWVCGAGVCHCCCTNVFASTPGTVHCHSILLGVWHRLACSMCFNTVLCLLRPWYTRCRSWGCDSILAGPSSWSSRCLCGLFCRCRIAFTIRARMLF